MNYADGLEIMGWLFVAWATGFGAGMMFRLIRQSLEATR